MAVGRERVGGKGGRGGKEGYRVCVHMWRERTLVGEGNTKQSRAGLCCADTNVRLPVSGLMSEVLKGGMVKYEPLSKNFKAKR